MSDLSIPRLFFVVKHFPVFVLCGYLSPSLHCSWYIYRQPINNSLDGTITHHWPPPCVSFPCHWTAASQLRRVYLVITYRRCEGSTGGSFSPSTGKETRLLWHFYRFELVTEDKCEDGASY